MASRFTPVFAIIVPSTCKPCPCTICKLCYYTKQLAPSGREYPDSRQPRANPRACSAFARAFPCRAMCCAERASPFPAMGRLRIRRAWRLVFGAAARRALQWNAADWPDMVFFERKNRRRIASCFCKTGLSSSMMKRASSFGGRRLSRISRVSPVHTIGVWSQRNLPPQMMTRFILCKVYRFYFLL